MQYDKITVMCPTYGRHNDKLPLFINSAIQTANNVDNLIFCFVVNQNDPESRQCIYRHCKSVHFEIVDEKTTSPHLSMYYNLAFNHMSKINPDALVSMFGDDMEFVTEGWDNIIIDQMNRMCGFGLVTGDDDYCQHGEKPVYFVTSRWFVELTGGVFMPENVKVDILDDIWRDICFQLGCYEYLPHLHIKHNHATKLQIEDVTWIRNRQAYFEQGDLGKFAAEYPIERANNVVKKMNQVIPADVAPIMTCYDRIPLLMDTMKSWNASVLLPPAVVVTDDCSTDFETVKRIVGQMKGAKLIRAPEHRGCDKNNVLSIRDAISDESIKWVFVIDSDTKFSRYWFLKFIELKTVADSEESCIGFTLFNAKEHKAIGYHEGYKKKISVGGLGTAYKADCVREALKDYDFSKLIPSWDNKVNDYVKEKKMFFLCSKMSFLQHTGYFHGTHVGDLADSDYATDFIGDDLRMNEEKRKKPVSGNIMVAALARLGDVIAASCIVNMIIDKGLNVTWLVIPKYAGLIKHICSKATVEVIEPIVGGPQGDWSETNSVVMQEMFSIGYNARVNLQIGSREHHARYLNSGMHPLDYLRVHAENELGIDLPTDYLRYFRFNQCGIQISNEMHSLSRNLVVISPDAVTSKALTEEMVNILVEKYKGLGYEVRKMVEKRPDKTSIFDIRNNYIIKHSVEQCVMIIMRADVFIGNDSGMAWASLFSRCKKIIYHNKDRLKMTNTRFSRIDTNAEDVEIDSGFTLDVPEIPEMKLEAQPKLTPNASRQNRREKRTSGGEPVQHGPRGTDPIGRFDPPPINATKFEKQKGKGIVTFSSGGGLGNMLCQYSIARLICEKNGFHLGTKFEYPGIIKPYMPKANEIYGPEGAQLIHEGVNSPDVLNDKYEKTHYHFAGYWQEAHYYTQNRNYILSLFNKTATTKPNKDDIVMHVRLGDYKIFGNGGNVLDPKYYHDCLKNEKYKKLYIVTNDPHDSYFNEFRKYKPEIKSSVESEDFWFITGFDRIICGNSTFSWWAAFVSNASKLWVPKCWIRNSDDIRHNMTLLKNGKCKATVVPATFKEY